MSRRYHVLGLVIVVAMSVSVIMVSAGYMTATSSVGSGGTTFTIFWHQGCGPNCDVRWSDGTSFESVDLLMGPNSCNINGALGNMRAIHCLIGSDAGSTSEIDAMVNCNTCHCEPDPGTYFECEEARGRCIDCDACDPNPCGSFETCTHLTCSTYSCDCDDDLCWSNTPWVCTANDPGLECGTVAGTEIRDERRCRSGACTWESRSRSCSVNLGSCPLGYDCVNNMCVSSASACECRANQPASCCDGLQPDCDDGAGGTYPAYCHGGAPGCPGHWYC
jgi:hypothetical protein